MHEYKDGDLDVNLAKMGFILGVQRRISDTSEPIWMKLWG